MVFWDSGLTDVGGKSYSLRAEHHGVQVTPQYDRSCIGHWEPATLLRHATYHLKEKVYIVFAMIWFK